MFTWKDRRIVSGNSRIARTWPEQPTHVCKTVGGSTVHWQAQTLRLLAREFRPRTTYGAIEGASLIDWPIGLEDLLPYYERAERNMGVSGRGGRPFHPAATAPRSSRWAPDASAIAISARPHGNQPGALRWAQRVRSDRLLRPGLRLGRQMVDALCGYSQGRGERALRGPCELHGATDSPRRAGPGVGRPLRRPGRRATRPESPRRVCGRQFNRNRTAVAQLGNGRLSRGSGKFLGPGRAPLQPHRRGLRLRRIRAPGPHAPRDTGAGVAAGRGPPRRGARLRRRRPHDALRRGPRPAMPRRSIPPAGAAPTRERSKATITPSASRSTAPTCRWRTTASASIPPSADRYGLPVPALNIDDHPNDVAMINYGLKRATALLQAAGARRITERRPTRHRKISAPAA